MRENDANVGSIIDKLANDVAKMDLRVSNMKIQLLKDFKEIEYRASIGMNEDLLLDYLIACFFEIRNVA
jgi:hypothetical protein